MRSEGGIIMKPAHAVLQYSINPDGSEGLIVTFTTELLLYISVISHGSEGRPEEMICLKKVMIENEV